MGLFDRLKKAFRHDKKQEEQVTEEKDLINEEDIDSEESVSEQLIVDENQADATEESQKIDTSLDISDVEEVQVLLEDTENAENTSSEQQEELSNTEDVEDIDESIHEDELEDFIADTSDEVSQTQENNDLENSDISDNSELLTDDKQNNSEDQSDDEDIEVIQEQESTDKYEKGLEKTRKSFGERLNELFANFRRVDEDFFDELEETLILSDVGLDTAVQLTEELKQEVKLQNAKKPRDVQNTIIEKLVDIYDSDEEIEINQSLNMQADLTVILFVGVNGAGKTTTIGKMANQFKNEGKNVLMAAADTFRAGAINQLIKWGERSNVEVVSGKEGGDPAAVVYDAVHKAKEENYDVLLVDTAGRLQNKEHLMRELDKIKRVIQKELPEAPHEVLLVVDSTTGQNALIQAQKFKETTDVTGLVLTKLDGTAKGGIILAIRNELKIPVKYVGLGEKIDDLAPFNSEQFVYGLFKDLWMEE